MGLLVTIILLATLLLSVPVGMSLALAALAGMLFVSPDVLIMLPQKFLSGLDSFPLLAIPLFVLAGQLMSHGGIARRIMELALLFVGWIPGGLGLVTILSTMLMSGISGSPSANTAAIGSVTLPALRRENYPRAFSTAILASGGGVSTLVPPAIDLILIGVIANISIGGLFAAGVLPALANGLAIMLLVVFFARRLALPLAPPVAWPQRLRIVRDGLFPTLMVFIILGGIYGGVFTPTEAASVAVVYGFVLSFFIYRELHLRDLPGILLKTCSLTGVVLLVLATASMFSFILTFERIPHWLAENISLYADNWVVFILCVHLVFFVLGMVMDALPAILVLVPILLPVAISSGMEPMHFGILVAANVGIGMVTPPVGICLYVACGMNDTPIEMVVRPLLPFLLVLMVTLLLITFLPEITLFLPRLLGFV